MPAVFSCFNNKCANLVAWLNLYSLGVRGKSRSEDLPGKCFVEKTRYVDENVAEVEILQDILQC